MPEVWDGPTAPQKHTQQTTLQKCGNFKQLQVARITELLKELLKLS